MRTVSTDHMCPTVLAELMEHVPYASVAKHGAHVVDLVRLQPITLGKIPQDVKDRHERVDVTRLALRAQLSLPRQASLERRGCAGRNSTKPQCELQQAARSYPHRPLRRMPQHLARRLRLHPVDHGADYVTVARDLVRSQQVTLCMAGGRGI